VACLALPLLLRALAIEISRLECRAYFSISESVAFRNNRLLLGKVFNVIL
jgi:hypothetical protein